MRTLFHAALLGFLLTALSNLPGFCQATSDATTTPSTPIPAVTSGTIELKELKPTQSMTVHSSQSRIFKTKTKILRVAVSDPSIAEPVVISEKEFMLLGKAPGDVCVFIWCE
ncbi:MAG TPA: pilus assembly protein N-terminal domain-containing protein [Candidatus Obscuribacterales bacterium]